MDTPERVMERKISLSANAGILQENEFALRNRSLEIISDVTVTVSEITLYPTTELELVAVQSSLQCLIPLVGEIKLESGLMVELGELWSQFKPKNAPMTLSNPASKESIHFLRIEIPTPNYFPETFSPFISGHIRDRVHPVFTHRGTAEYFRISLGNLGGRKDVGFFTHAASLALVISGAIEYENCLLERGDCLLIPEACEVEMESLAEESLLLILEFGRSKRESPDPLRN